MHPPIPTTMKRWQWRQRWTLAAFLAPTLAYLFVWKGAPLLYTICLSFTSWNPLRRPVPILVGFANYVQIAADPHVLAALVRTLAFTVGASTAELLLGLALALLLDAKIRGANIIRTIILLPIVIAPAVVGTIWYLLFHDTIGPVAYVFKSMGFDIGWLRDPSTALISIGITDIWHWTPFMFLIILAGLQVIPGELYEAARIDGAGYVDMLRHIKLPLLKNTLIVALILRSMDAFRIFDEIFLMTGGGPGESTTTTTVLIYKSAFKAFQLGYAAALVVVLLAISAALYVGYMRHVDLDAAADSSAR